MIIGHGDIASVLKDRKDLVFFASGVSNSQETDDKEFARERGLLYELSQKNRNAHFVYFSSISVFWGDTPYHKHKMNMEALVKKWFASWTIVRLGNIAWGKNPHTIINFLRNKIKKGEPIEIQQGYRYIVDLDEFLYWIDLIPSFNCEMTIPGKRMRIIDIAKEYGYA